MRAMFAGLVLLFAACFDPHYDNLRCGALGPGVTPCPDGLTCIDGDCLAIDATTVPDAMPMVPDAVPSPDACPLTYCPTDVCVDTSSDEQHCGNCTTVCSGGQYCASPGVCSCPPAFVPATPTLGQTQLQSLGANLVIGFGLYSDSNDSMPDGLLVGYDPTSSTVGYDYTLSATPGTPPFIGAGFHVNIDGQTPTADAAAYVTAGTITFDTVCASGFSGHAANLVFSCVTSLTDPTIDPNGCSFTLGSLTFSYGTACP